MMYDDDVVSCGSFIPESCSRLDPTTNGWLQSITIIVLDILQEGSVQKFQAEN
jgi:hypothetical protein